MPGEDTKDAVDDEEDEDDEDDKALENSGASGEDLLDSLAGHTLPTVRGDVKK